LRKPPLSVFSFKIMESLAKKVDTNDKAQMIDVIRSSLGTKFVSRWGDLMCDLAYKAVKTVTIDANGVKEIDIKRYARVEKVPEHSKSLFSYSP